ncbi:YadA C-terminal domain-containing protein [Citrobacter braakii]|uniref:YadA C-terminal domain-containing protein n=1 Tax=Citrobacter braakii TaxID=57706 RepID=UPI001F3B8261|nr:YadA C-terminal domain-containing protein [Citrobacter braakii]MCF2472352.1 YadA C-terminal domain-containing protein [Citrobacter braakii]WFV21407.1 YadA C-terminal domain-containing protein [Citrobacter braakii]
MKAVKTLVAFTILASFGVNANGYIIPHQPGTPEYDLMANGVMVNGEYQINGVAVPGVKVVDIGQMGYDLEQVITDMEKQKVTNQVILDDVGYVQNIAETANTNATEALRKVEDYKGIIDLNTSDITQIKHHLDTMTSVDVSGKAEQSDLTAVSDRVTSTEVSLTNINTEMNNKADKADLDAKADKTEVTAAISNAVADKVNQNQVDTSIAEAVAGKVDKTELVKVADTASKNTQMVNELNDLKADKNTVQDVADTVGGLQKTMLEKADKETVQNLSVAVSGKADKSDVDAAHSKADQINQILHGATSTMGTDSTGDIGLIAKVDKNTTDVQNVKTDIQVVSTQVSSIVDSVNQATTQAAEAKSQVDIATVKADVAQTTANTAYNMADTTQRQVAGFDGRITGIEQEVNGLNKSFSDLKAKVDRNEKKANAGIASVAALAGLPTVAGSKFSLGAATGGYSGEQAIAVGVNYNVSDRVAVKAGVSTTSATQVAYSTGIAVGF